MKTLDNYITEKLIFTSSNNSKYSGYKLLFKYNSNDKIAEYKEITHKIMRYIFKKLKFRNASDRTLNNPVNINNDLYSKCWYINSNTEHNQNIFLIFPIEEDTFTSRQIPGITLSMKYMEIPHDIYFEDFCDALYNDGSKYNIKTADYPDIFKFSEEETQENTYIYNIYIKQIKTLPEILTPLFH